MSNYRLVCIKCGTTKPVERGLRGENCACGGWWERKFVEEQP